MLPAARVLAAAARALQRRVAAPARGLAAAGAKTTKFFVKRAGGSAFVGVEVAAGADVDALVAAALARLRIDAPPDWASLARACGGGAPLDARLSLVGAKLSARDELVLTVLAPPPLPPLDLSVFTNLISRGPDARADADTLAAFTDARAPAAARVRALSELVRGLVACDAGALDPWGAALPIFETTTHTALLDELLARARSLSAGYYDGHNGAPNCTLVGAKGIGKSLLLRAFAAIAPSAFPDLVVIYVSCEGSDAAGSSFAAAPLLDLLAAAAAARGVTGAAGARNLTELVVALRTARKRVLLLFDEMDELYTVGANDPRRACVLATLGALALLGGQQTGLFSVVLCGSSLALPRLLAGGDADLGERFELARGGAPRLSAQKFPRLDLPLAPCTATH